MQFDSKVWVDHQELGSEELFKRVAKGAAMPSTQPPTVEAYCAKLEELLQKHEHVFAVHISHKLSQTVEHAQQAAQAFAGRVTVVDAYNSSGALTMQAHRASRLLTQQIAPEQVKVLLELLLPQVSTRMCLNTMSYLHKNGHIGGATALLGGWLNIKPIVGLQDGKVEAFGRPLGAPRALWAGPKSWTVSSRDSAQIKGTTLAFSSCPGDGLTATFAVGSPQRGSAGRPLACSANSSGVW
ncbi:hypothetical protein Dxin01_01294 [Deinococcus xinjiangensis]|uniref:Uncharacterized protein n=1 Tax=Deinococcus xinjiangensis TaxID=457454 RepID=A0ABP9VCX6_9DEIO